MLGRFRTPTTLALGVLVATMPLAGCMSGSSETLTYSSFDEAESAPGAGPFEPHINGSQLETLSEDEAEDIKIKLLTPSSTSGLEQGEQDVAVLLWDDSTGEPITDATFAMEARMPSMGHGTSPEEAPTHETDGQYVGMTTWSMNGSWSLRFDVQLDGGDVLHYDIHMDVGEGEHGHDEGDGHDHEH
jgi:hypothetical protein